MKHWKSYFSLVLLNFLLLALAGGCDKYAYPPTNTTRTLGLKYRGPQVKRDMPEIRASDTLKAIAIYNSTEYFLYRGQAMGFEYELLKELAETLDLQLEMVVAKNVNELFDMLNSGQGDIIASGLTITEPRRKIISFTDYHYVTHQALVQRKPKNWRSLPGYKLDKLLVSDLIDLIGDTVHVLKQSSYYERLLNLQQEIGGQIYIDTNLGSSNTDDIIKQVVDGKIKYTVADYNLAAINKTYYPILDIETPVSFSQRIAWAVRKNSPQLTDTINQWVAQMRKKDLYYLLYNKYFKNKKSYKRRIRSEFYSRNSGKISPYDSLLKLNAQKINWDWRLLASLVYQESQFNPNAQSWAGARGLMQMMPATAAELGVRNAKVPEENIAGGSKYLNQIWNKFENIPDSLQRIKFTMASYNCGYGHLLDAQRLTKKYGDNPLLYDDNVENYLRKMSSAKYYADPIVRYGYVRGEEPYRYVRDIFLRFFHYTQLLPGKEEDSTVLTSK
jgi:membrane-bound lytic murein transglycosylase F